MYIFLNPDGFLPYSEVPFEYYIQPFHNLIPWIGKEILHLYSYNKKLSNPLNKPAVST